MKLIILLVILIIPRITYASDITNASQITLDGKNIVKITDNKESTYVSIDEGSIINIDSPENIDGIYIIYEMASKKGNILIDNKEIKIGQNGFLHEYVSLKSDSKNLKITYEENVKIADIYVLSKGALPEFVEVWEPPCTEADLLLFSTHSDDEQLFFLGLMPTYVARGAYVQVAYFTNHYDNPKRLHEQLHGLYTVGIRNYPIIGIIPDAYSESLKGALNNIKKANLTEDDAMQWEVEMIRRFKPSVIVGHDELGEYSHGQHILNTHILKNAIIKANDNNYDIASFQKYGVWDTPKTYLHLYKENPIVMNYDEPLEYFNGKTAYEVSKEGYKKHLSQQWTWFTAWINGKNNEYTKATQIKKYSPLEFGLYRSTVGEDKEKNDMFENIVLKKNIIKDVPSNTENKEEIKAESSIEKNKNNYYILIGTSIFVILVLITLLTKKKKVLK